MKKAIYALCIASALLVVFGIWILGFTSYTDTQAWFIIGGTAVDALLPIAFLKFYKRLTDED